MFQSFDEVQKMIMGDQGDFDKGGAGFMQNFEQQYHKEARKREIERMKREFMDLKARNFKRNKKEEEAAAAAKKAEGEKKEEKKDEKKDGDVTRKAAAEKEEAKQENSPVKE
jgi:sRNA-binding protein